MNIYKLEKQVTPGPWKVNNCDIGIVNVFKPVSPGVQLSVAEFQYNTNKAKCGGSRANARFAAHCRNNFMEALAALKIARSKMYRLDFLQYGVDFDALIAKLEEVT